MRRQLTILTFFITSVTLAQDAQFSQFYAAPLYLNPAFAGTTIKTRAIMNFRDQWSSLPGSFTTYSASVDFNLEEMNSGVGLLVTTDKAGQSKLNTTDVGAIYSYSFNINNDLVVRTGLQASYVNRSLNYADLIFGSQLNASTGFTGSSSGENLNGNPRTSYFDFSAGGLIYDKIFWFGISAHHLNEPIHSFQVNSGSKLPRKFTFSGGAKIKVIKGQYTNNSRELTFSPAFIYKFQGTYDQLDLGMYVNYNPVVFGIWYRGLPLKRYAPGYGNHDALAFLIGFHQDHFTVGYSYDLTVSRLGTPSGGSHELSIGYEIDWPVNKKRRLYEKYIPCPKF